SARQRAAAGKPRGGVLGPEGRAWLARAEATATGLDVRFDPGKWAEALNAFGYGAVYEQALCRWFYARALLASQSRQCSALAAQQLRTANETSLRLAAEPLGAAVRSLARRAGVRWNPAEATPAQQGPLTGRGTGRPGTGRCGQDEPPGGGSAVHQRQDRQRAPVEADGQARCRKPRRGSGHRLRPRPVR